MDRVRCDTNVLHCILENNTLSENFIKLPAAKNAVLDLYYTHRLKYCLFSSCIFALTNNSKMWCKLIVFIQKHESHVSLYSE